MKHLLKVALTGGIATGKSVVASILEKKGCYIDHADQVAHELIKPKRDAWRSIVVHFGRDILNSDQTINRSQLAKIVFSNNKKRAFLNRLIHPLVMRENEKTVRKLARQGRYRIFISEAALTIESGFASFFDKIIVVYCPREVQIKRLMERDKINRSEAQKRLVAQIPGKKKLKYADYVIDSSRSLRCTVRQADQVYESLLQDYEKSIEERKKRRSYSEYTAG